MIEGTLHITPDIEGAVSMGTILFKDGTNNYERLTNKPSIDGHELVGDSTLAQIGVWHVTEQEIDEILYG